MSICYIDIDIISSIVGFFVCPIITHEPILTDDRNCLDLQAKLSSQAVIKYCFDVFLKDIYIKNKEVLFNIPGLL